MVDLPDPGAAIGLGLKLNVVPAPPPDADNVMAELKPPDTVVVIVYVPELPAMTACNDGDALMAKLPEPPPTEVTVKETLVVDVVLPEDPVIVSV